MAAIDGLSLSDCIIVKRRISSVTSVFGVSGFVIGAVEEFSAFLELEELLILEDSEELLVISELAELLILEDWEELLAFSELEEPLL